MFIREALWSASARRLIGPLHCEVEVGRRVRKRGRMWKTSEGLLQGSRQVLVRPALSHGHGNGKGGWLCKTSSSNSYLEDTCYSTVLGLRGVEHIRKMNQALSVGSIHSIYRCKTDKDDF